MPTPAKPNSLQSKLPTGGVTKNITNMIPVDNDPFEKKKEYNNKASDIGLQEIKPMMEFKMYDTPAKKPQREITAQYPLYVPSAATNNLKYLFTPNRAYTFGPNYEMPVQRVNNIIIPSASHDGHLAMSSIFEDILPETESKRMTYNTLGERLTINDYLRQVLIKLDDGQEISLNRGQNNIMSYIKLMELNGNFFNKLSKNPYKSLPFGLLVYKSAYPIRLDQGSQSIVPAKNSIKLNFRIYSLNLAEFISQYVGDEIYREYDTWRELIYYEYVREEIAKPRMCPNFVVMHSWHKCINSKIDFFKLKTREVTQLQKKTAEYRKFSMLTKTFHKIDGLSFKKKKRNPAFADGDGVGPVKLLPDEIDEELQKYSGNCLVMLTEAPNYNIYDWASRKYEKKGVVNKMISHGFYSEDVWLSILFQLAAAMYVMEIKGLLLREMTLADNVFINELHTNGAIKNYWKYVIDGISYYIPNYGFLLQIDTNFKDINVKSALGTKVREYKFYANGMFNTDYDSLELRREIIKNFRNMFNTNSFGKDYLISDVNRPPESIMNFLNRVIKFDEETSIGDIISNMFRPFCNNRIGTYLKKDTEAVNVRMSFDKNLERGDMMAYTENNDIYVWVLFIEYVDEARVKILTREKPDSNDIIEKEVNVSNLRSYNPAVPIEQLYKSGETKISEETIVETYIIRKESISK